MKAISLADISYQDALELLMMRKEALDSGKAEPLSKEARDVSLFVKAANNYFEQAKNWISDKANNAASSYQDFAKNNPDVSSAINYGLIGAGALGAGSLAHSAATKDKNWKRKALRNALLGGGAGVATNLLVKSPTIGANIADKIAPKKISELPPELEAKKNTLINKAYTAAPEAGFAAYAGTSALPAAWLRRVANEKALDRSALTKQLMGDLEAASREANPIQHLSKKYNLPGLNRLLGDSTDASMNSANLEKLFTNMKPPAATPALPEINSSNLSADDFLKHIAKSNIPDARSPVDLKVNTHPQPVITSLKTPTPPVAATPPVGVAPYKDIYSSIAKSPALKQMQYDPAAVASSVLSDTSDDAARAAFAKNIVTKGLLEQGENAGHNWSLKGIKPTKQLRTATGAGLIAALLGMGASSYRNNIQARAEARRLLGDKSPSDLREYLNALTGGIAE